MNHFSPSFSLILMLVAWNQFVWNAIYDKQWAEFTELIDQLIRNMNVDLEESG